MVSKNLVYGNVERNLIFEKYNKLFIFFLIGIVLWFEILIKYLINKQTNFILPISPYKSKFCDLSCSSDEETIFLNVVKYITTIVNLYYE